MTYEERKEYYKKYWLENKDKLTSKKKEYYKKNKEKINSKKRDYNERNRDLYILNKIKQRAVARGLDFDLVIDDIAFSGNCPILGVPLVRNKGGFAAANSPSIDRIIPSLGYTKGNIQVISNRANMMKSDATPEELRMFAKWVLKTFPEEPDAQT